jgi:hypothetical protein
MAKITGIAIENFKGIRDRVEIDLKPVTLLFGANSAGKSTILHALHYAREIFERHNLDPDRTISGGSFVDLGGFENLVHGHDLDRSVKLEFTIALDSHELATALDEWLSNVQWKPGWSTHIAPAATVFFADVTSATISVEVSWSRQFSKPFVRCYNVSFDGERFAYILHEPGRVLSELGLNVSHHKLSSVEQCYDSMADSVFDCSNEETSVSGLGHAMSVAGTNSVISEEALWYSETDRKWYAHFDLERRLDALPEWDRPLHIDQFDTRDYDDDEPHSDDPVSSTILGLRAFLSEAISHGVVAPGKLLQDALMGLKYLGPLRETPSREYTPPKYKDPSRWACGLGAWDALQSNEDNVVETVSQWLSDSERLNSGYSLNRKEYKELDLNIPFLKKLAAGRTFDEDDDEYHSWQKLVQLPTHVRIVIVPESGGVELRPHDVGIGISQVVPVLVTALAEREHLLGIEQPELHLHPRLQAELGDLFIEAALGERNHTVLLETHSEHLILRLLRRIRETTDGDLPQGKQAMTPDDLSVYYIDQTADGAKATRLRVDETGEFMDRWPAGFFEERAKELF